MSGGKRLLTKLNDNEFWNRTRGSNQRRSKASLQGTTSRVEDRALKTASRRAEIRHALTNMIKSVTNVSALERGKVESWAWALPKNMRRFLKVNQRLRP